jgi:formylglycine-generating enzyme required for sulfatase activity
MAAITIHKRLRRNQFYLEALAENVLPLQMMQIPGGAFLMGSPEDEEERRDCEGPQHEVTVAPFFMAAYPVTQIQWRVVAAMKKVEHELDPDPSQFKGDLHPVEKVSWYNAMEFCTRLTHHTHRQYRLPTEAEWEYACRAGTMTPFHFGPTLSTDYANYNGADKNYGAYGPGIQGEYRRETTPVNKFEGANTFGLYDMHGNVWEWCQDTWHDSYEEGAPTDGSAWIEGGNESRRVRRGGSWFNIPRYCRSAYRLNIDSANRSYLSTGFRVCCSAPRPRGVS